MATTMLSGPACSGCSHPTVCRTHGCAAIEARRNQRMQEAAQARATDQVVQLRWHDVSAYGTPCSDRTVLVASGEEWHSAWWSADAGAWIDCASGGVVELQVTHWAEPVLPRDTAHDAGSIDWTLKTR